MRIPDRRQTKRSIGWFQNLFLRNTKNRFFLFENFHFSYFLGKSKINHWDNAPHFTSYWLLQSKREPDYLEADSTFLPLLVAFQTLKFNSYFWISAFDTFLINLNDSGVPWPLKTFIWFSAMHCPLSKRR